MKGAKEATNAVFTENRIELADRQISLSQSENTTCQANITVPGDAEGMRADAYIAEQAALTRSAVQKLMSSGDITVNGKREKKNYPLKAGDEIFISLPEPEFTSAEPEDIPLDIVYEDKYLLVVNKKKGMVVHPAPGSYSGTLVNALMHHCKDSLSGIGGVVRPGIVHRIDKETSGLLVVAKTDEAHLSLSEQISSHSFLRSYEAVAIGGFKRDSGRVEGAIGRHPADRKKMAIVKEGGKSAATNYEVLTRYGGFTHIKCVLETGRTHQIRVHMASLGHPIFGDTLYGGGGSILEKRMANISDEYKAQCLHAKTIGFVHPITGENMFFDSDLPEYFKKLLEKLQQEARK